MHAVVLVLSDI
jgi:hypothetical protein